MFRVIGGNVLFESGEKAITVLGDRAQKTRPIALSGEFDGRPRAARKLRGTRFNLDGYIWSMQTTVASISRRFF